MEKLILIGFIVILIGVVLIAIGALGFALSGKSKSNVAVGGFIGPIPFGFFTSKKMFLLWLIVLIIGVCLWLITRKLI